MATDSMTDTLQETLALFEDGGAPLATSEVADRLDVGRRSAYDRLERLADSSRLETKKVGAKARVWWRPETDADTAGSNGSEEFESLIEAVEEYAIFTLDPEGTVRTWNPGAERIKGYEAAEILGEHFSTFYTADDKAADVPQKNLAAAAARGSVEDEGWRVRADGSEFWANVTITAIRDDDGVLEGYAKVTRDMTERKRAEAERDLLYETTRAVAEAETFGDGLEAALERVCEATAWEYAEAWIPSDEQLRRADADHYEEQFAPFAAASEDVTFDRNEGLPGRVWASGTVEWVADLPDDVSGEFSRLEATRGTGAQSALGVPVVADGTVVSVLVFLASEARDADDRLVETVSSVAAKLGNLVERRRAEQRAAREREFVDRLLEASPVGIVVLDTDGEVTRMNDRAMEVLAVPDDEAETYSPADRAVYDADGDRVQPEDHPFARTLSTGEPVFDWEARVEIPDGGHRWLSVNAAPVADADGEIARVITTGEDVTRLKEQTRQLERQRDALEDELDEVFARIDDAFYAVDEEFRFTYVNERAEELLQHSGEDLLGRSVREVFPHATETPVWESLHEALDTQEPTSFEAYLEPLAFWVEANVYPSETGLSVHFRDVTERKERERELERYETVVETVTDGVYAVDENYELTMVNEAYAEMAGYDREELVGSPATAVLHEGALDDARALREDLRTGEGDVGSAEIDLETAAGERLTVEARYARLTSEDDEFGGTVGVVRDVTERKERERELERYETLFEESKDVNLVVDADGIIQYVTPSVSSVFGYERDELVGEVGFEHLHPADRDEARAEFAKMLEDPAYEPTVEFRFRHGDGSWITLEAMGRNLLEDPDIGAIVVYTRDVTDRTERERELERYETLVETMTDGVYVVDDSGHYRMVNDAYAEMVDLTRDELLGAHVTTVVDGDVAAQAQALERELRTGERDQARLVTKLPGSDGEAIDAEATFGLIPSEHGGAERVGVVRDVTERREREATLLQQREQLAALNTVSEVVRDISGAVIEQSTREEIEETVCEHLAETDSYSFAWVGEADTATRTVSVRAAAGTDGYLDGVTISTDAADDHGGPTGRALRSGSIQVIRDVTGDSPRDTWSRHATEYGVRSSAAIPIEYDGTQYGVLTVYSDRPHAFEDRERTVISQLGEVVGHAIAATERKRALLSDEVVEVEFRLAGLFETLDVGAPAAGTISIDEAVPVRDGEYLVYGTASDAAAENVPTVADAVSYWTDVTLRETGGVTRFEGRLSDPPILSAVASLGGSVEEAVIEDGDYRVTVHLSPSTEVARIVDAVRESFPEAEMVARRQVERPDDTSERVHRVVAEALTDRQDAALRAAYHAGYFEWPRDVSGEAVAESLSISVATFSQHLRKAEKKTFDALLGGSTGPSG